GAHPYTLLDVFTAEPLRGNGLAVVHDADGVGDEVMLRFARETRLSETSFVQSSRRDGADYRHRIWMMGGEIPFAGHPSLGVAAAVARLRGEGSATYVQETRAGLQPVEVELDGLRARVSMLQEPAVFGPELDPAEVLAFAGLTAADSDPDLPVQVVSTGVAQVLVPVRDPAALERARPDYEAIGALLGAHAAITFYLVAVDAAAGTARARSFAATAEMGEDPATGSAVGPLCAHVAARTGAQRLEVSQGVEMGRPSSLDAAIEGDRVRVGGDAVVVVEGTVHLDT
ncbi:MAG: PhzF family phenazine biosynthesis protein, partial [Actinomycetota bacterium]|nr:PhzF family phenazine biosynthesis protein [Actinomycetota bacterium]